MKVRDLSIGVRIIAFTAIFAGVIFVALSYLAVALSGSAELSRKQSDLVTIQREALQQQTIKLVRQKEVSERLRRVTELNRKFSENRYWLADLSVSWLNESESNAESAMEDMQKLLAQIEDSKLANSISERTNRFNEKMLEAVDSYVDENRVLGNSLMAEARRLGLTIDNDLIKLAESLQQQVSVISVEVGEAGIKVTEAGNQLSDAATQVADTSSRLLTLASVVMVVLLVVSGIYSVALKSNIHGPIVLFYRALEHIERESDLVYRVEVKSKDEIGIMSSALNKMMTHFQVVVSQVRNAANNLRRATNQSANMIERTQQGADQQQSATEQVSVAMNQMVATVEEVARHANEASSAATDAHDASEAGQHMVTETIKLIEELSTRTRHAHEVVTRVSTDSSNIGSVLDVIRGISEQTNLLALNAAIEAARAGESGRGFAVVADEVRTLAQRTQESTQEIQSMISRLQEGSSSAEKEMETSVEYTDKAVKQAAAAGEALQRINTAVQGIVDVNLQIATAAEQQTATADEINRNITAITEYAVKTTQGASETNKACGEQIALSEELNELVNKFNI